MHTSVADASKWPAPTWLRLASFALASRLLTLGAGLLLASREPGPHWTPEQLAFRADVLAGPVPWLEPWIRFDAGYYLAIAREGYGDQWPEPKPEESRRKAAFLPLLPWCIAALATVGMNPVLAAVLLPNLAFTLGMACAGRAALRVFGDARTVWLGCVVLVTFPTAFYFSAPYQESLYLLATAGGLLAWRHGRSGVTAVAGFVAALGRLTAVALPIGLFFEAIAQRRWPSVAAVVVAFATALGVGVALQSIAGTKGSLSRHFYAHRIWGRESPSVGGAVTALGQAGRELVQPNPVYAIVKPLALFGTIALGVRGWVRRGPLWGCLILIPVAQALSTGTTLSIERIVLTSFPAAFELGELLGRSRMMRIAWVVVAVPAQLFFLWLFANNGFLN